MFQKSILNRYLNQLDTTRITKAYQQFTAYFHDKERQNNIRLAKEEQFQEGFLNALFVQILGYRLHPEDNYTLITEFKNQKNAKKADGAILRNQQVIAVIELKGTKQQDLNKIEAQAFQYKNNQTQCRYVIISNFEKLRLYIDTALTFIEWDLFTLSETDFKLLWLLLQQENLFTDMPANLKAESLIQEEEISKIFYQQYANFRKELFQSLTACNPTVDKLLLFKKTQKLLDRFLFLLFAEDKLLIPANTVLSLLNQWQADKKNIFVDKLPLYDYFKKYFYYLDIGLNNEKFPIFAYNGGLFATDALLDTLQIDDAVLFQGCQALLQYDYESDIDVNILGHIFEHSLKELEELSLQQLDSDILPQKTKKSSKRKKDGIFYTPPYITQYIVNQTLGVLCREQKLLLNLEESDYFFRKANKANNAEIKDLLDKLHQYQQWLFALTILDPACGSGAFLNEALRFLINEHQWLNSLEAKLTGSTIVFDLENSILENNLFGVDINEESVEIAKLSLWLRTAKPQRKLTALNNNIRCGNSLIDSQAVAGELAFNWQAAFPQVFTKGGFDVIIGNPPYVRLQGLKANYEQETHYYVSNYQSATANYDIYVLFMEKAFSLLKSTGRLSFILPHKFLISEFGEGIRDFLVKYQAVEQLLHFGSEIVFEEASTYTCIVTLSHYNDSLTFKHLKPQAISYLNLQAEVFEKVPYSALSKDKWHLTSDLTAQILNKLKQQPLTVKAVFAKIFQGIATSADEIYLIQGVQQGEFVTGFSKALDKTVTIERALLKPLLKGEDISRYAHLQNRYFVIFPYLLEKNKSTAMTEEYIKTHFPLGYAYLKENETTLRSRENGKMDKEGWFLYIYPKNLNLIDKTKLVVPDITLGIQITVDNTGYCVKSGGYGLVISDDYKSRQLFYLGILNSSLLWFFLKNTGTELRGGYFRFQTKYIEPFPLPDYADSVTETFFIEKVSKLLNDNQRLTELKTDFSDYVTAILKVSSLSKALQNPEKLSFEQLTLELEKKKVVLTDLAIFKMLKQLHADMLALKTEIVQTEQVVNEKVYLLYQLTPEEIQHIELH